MEWETGSVRRVATVATRDACRARGTCCETVTATETGISYDLQVNVILEKAGKLQHLHKKIDKKLRQIVDGV